MRKVRAWQPRRLLSGAALCAERRDGARWGMRPAGSSWLASVVSISKRPAQNAKLKAAPSRFNHWDIPTVGSDGRRREMTCIPLRRYPMWLASIQEAGDLVPLGLQPMPASIAGRVLARASIQAA